MLSILEALGLMPCIAEREEEDTKLNKILLLLSLKRKEHRKVFKIF
jgi:hypothetical protein